MRGVSSSPRCSVCASRHSPYVPTEGMLLLVTHHGTALQPRQSWPFPADPSFFRYRVPSIKGIDRGAIEAGSSEFHRVIEYRKREFGSALSHGSSRSQVDLPV